MCIDDIGICLSREDVIYSVCRYFVLFYVDYVCFVDARRIRGSGYVIEGGEWERVEETGWGVGGGSFNAITPRSWSS